MQRAAIYCRISNDREGRALGVDRQEKLCRDLAERLGYTVIQVFIDNDRSASRRARKPRPDFDAMIGLARQGGLDAIIAYSTSRLTRRPLEHELLIPLFEERRIMIRTVKAGDHDYTTARGRSRARDDARRDAEEAEETGERVADAARQRAEQGRPHGGQVLFGLDTSEHAAMVKEAVRRLLNGETLYGVCTDWNRQGKGQWYTPTLKRILLNPGLVGMRQYKGEVFPAKHDAVLDRDDWERLGAILTDPARAPKRGRPDKYLLSGMLWCGTCGHRLTASKGSFQCQPQRGGCGRMRVNMTPLDQYVTAMFFASLDERRGATPPPRDDREAELRTAVDKARRALALRVKIR